MPLVTITRTLGSGGMDVARLVAEGLNVDLYDDARFQEEAHKKGLKPDELSHLDERAPGFLEQFMSHKPEAYLNVMESLVYTLAGSGDGVIIGHGSQILLRDFGCALHVLIHSSDQARFKHLSDARGLSPENALKMVKRSDSKQKGFFRFAFNMDWDDHSLYDLVINPEKLGPQLAAKMIIQAAQSREMSECNAKALESMERFALVKKALAELIRNGVDTSLLHLEAPSKGEVQISGVVYNPSDKALIDQALKGLPGLTAVHSEIAVVRTYE